MREMSNSKAEEGEVHDQSSILISCNNKNIVKDKDRSVDNVMMLMRSLRDVRTKKVRYEMTESHHH